MPESLMQQGGSPPISGTIHRFDFKNQQLG
jgi:hypothetical protein